MAFARVNGVVLHYEERGARDKRAIVFSNSLGTDFRIWDDVAQSLETDYRLLRYDKRGHGLSEATPAPYSIDDHVGDIAALMDHCGVKEAAIVGLSVGGVIAQGLAAKRPDLVKALVLSDTAQKIGTDDLWNTRIAAVTTKGIASIAEGIMQRWFSAAYRDPSNPDFVGYTAMLTRTTADGYAGTCAALRDADMTNSTRKLKLPALCIVGDEDGSTPPELVKSLANLIEGSQYKVVDGAGHLPCIEKPEEVAGLIRSFLKQINHA